MKYIIELTENQKKQMDFMLDMANKHMGFNRKLEMIETTNVEDTSEYEIGYKTGYDKGYYDGYDKCLHSSANDDYEKGKLDGLEEFENLFINEYDYEQFFEDTYGTKDPDYNLYDLVAKYGAKKVVNDFNKWQEEKKKAEEEIKVGDEVKDLATNNIGVVLSIGERILYVTKFDYVYSNTRGSLEKTGRHFDEIEQLLDKMRGE